MTEKEVWLKIAEMFDSVEPTWKGPGYYRRVIGICQATIRLADPGIGLMSISYQMAERLNARLGEYFRPNGKDPACDFFWPENCHRASRTLRATACCFLAAMCND